MESTRFVTSAAHVTLTVCVSVSSVQPSDTVTVTSQTPIARHTASTRDEMFTRPGEGGVPPRVSRLQHGVEQIRRVARESERD